MSELTRAKQFFMLARERYNIKLKRDAGEPPPWTKDTHLQTWRFTNIFREDDKTTSWFRENIRKHLDGLSVVEATLIFRWFNRISTGEIIKDLLLNGWDTEEARRRLKNVHPVCTGAYMIKTYDSMDKLSGILLAIDGARRDLPRMVPKWGATLEGAWADLKTIHYLGGFMAHEIVQDLRYTPILRNATDVMTWGHLGPGAIRGMSWVVYGNEYQFTSSASSQRGMLKLMAELLELSKQNEYWPREWPAWEMHQVEFLLCEFSKYMKAYSGIPQKRRYSYSHGG